MAPACCGPLWAPAWRQPAPHRCGVCLWVLTCTSGARPCPAQRSGPLVRARIATCGRAGCVCTQVLFRPASPTLCLRKGRPFCEPQRTILYRPALRPRRSAWRGRSALPAQLPHGSVPRTPSTPAAQHDDTTGTRRRLASLGRRPAAAHWLLQPVETEFIGGCARAQLWRCLRQPRMAPMLYRRRPGALASGSCFRPAMTLEQAAAGGVWAAGFVV